MQKYKISFAEALARATHSKAKDILPGIEVPANPEYGDLAVPCFIFSKSMKKNPAEIAKELEKLEVPGFRKLEAKGAYINAFVDETVLAGSIIPQILKQKSRFGSLNLQGRKAVIEHTSINPNAAPHVGRARNAIIGDSITRLLRFHGYETYVRYYVNDIGKQIALLVHAIKDRDVTFDQLLEEYVKANRELEENKDTEKKVFELLHRLEQRDEATIRAFKRIVNICIEGQKRIMSEFGIRYDSFDYESDYLFKDETSVILGKLKKTGKVFVDEDNRLVVDLKDFKLPMKVPVFVLTRSDGTSLYSLRDLAYTSDKGKSNPEKNIWVLGEDHKLYSQQLKSTLSLIGVEAPEIVYYAFVLLQDDKMSTRKGNVVLLEEFMKEAKEKALKKVREQNEGIDDSKAEEIAKVVGYGAIKYQFLKVSPEKNVSFDWQQAMNFEADSGPYLQYSYVRIQSILEKTGSPGSTDFSLLSHAKEAELVKALAGFPEIAERALTQLRPHIIANYLYRVADIFNQFYHDCPVLKAEPGLRDARTALIMASAHVLESGMQLLGMDAPSRM